MSNLHWVFLGGFSRITTFGFKARLPLELSYLKNNNVINILSKFKDNLWHFFVFTVQPHSTDQGPQPLLPLIKHIVHLMFNPICRAMTYAIILFIVLLLLIIFLFNNLIAKKNKTLEAYSSIDVMLKKRTDLIPQLIKTVKGYMVHERETLTEITKLREKIVTQDHTNEERLNLENQMNQMLGKLQIAVEAYPDLKSSENFLLLQSSLNDVEEQISAARRAYNASVNSFNNTLEMFPSNLVGKIMGYSPKTFFIIDPLEAELPSISFD
jgi:LemA protein